MTDHRTFIDDYFKILDFIEWLKENHPGKTSYHTSNIGDDAFCGCFELSCIKIGDNVISIGWDVFIYSNAKEIFCKATKPPFLGGNSYGDNVFPDTLKAIYVPVESVDAYKNADGWKEYANDIVGYDFENNSI